VILGSDLAQGLARRCRAALVRTASREYSSASPRQQTRPWAFSKPSRAEPGHTHRRQTDARLRPREDPGNRRNESIQGVLPTSPPAAFAAVRGRSSGGSPTAPVAPGLEPAPSSTVRPAVSPPGRSARNQAARRRDPGRRGGQARPARPSPPSRVSSTSATHSSCSARRRDSNRAADQAQVVFGDGQVGVVGRDPSPPARSS